MRLGEGGCSGVWTVGWRDPLRKFGGARRSGRICRLETKHFELRGFVWRGLERGVEGAWRGSDPPTTCQQLAELEPAGRNRESGPLGGTQKVQCSE